MHPMEVKIGGKELKLSQNVDPQNGAWRSDNQQLVWHNQDLIEATFIMNMEVNKFYILVLNINPFGI